MVDSDKKEAQLGRAYSFDTQERSALTLAPKEQRPGNSQANELRKSTGIWRAMILNHPPKE